VRRHVQCDVYRHRGHRGDPLSGMSSAMRTYPR
jgi:hypothetical protein